jgi:hypothetical protein
MTTDNHHLPEARNSFLDAIKGTESDTAVLKDLLEDLKSSNPALFAPYATKDEVDAIDTAPLHWTEQYFSTQIWYARKNFSHERLEHLIQVRELFRQEGRKGFMPTPQNMSDDMPPVTDTSYTPSINLRKFVEEGDVSTLQTALIVELENSRLDARDLRNAMAWTKARVPGLFEPYAEKAFARGFEHDRTQWTQEYYGKQVVFLDTNFSEERFLHLIDVREHLRQQAPVKATPAARPAPAARAPAASTAPAASAGPRPASGPSSAKAGAQQQQQQQRRTSTPTAQPGLSPAMRAALLVGGAVAVVVIVLLAMRK